LYVGDPSPGMVRVDVGKFNSVLTSESLEIVFDPMTSSDVFGIIKVGEKFLIFTSIFYDIDMLLLRDDIPLFISNMKRKKKRSLPINHIVGVRLRSYLDQWKV
jgi:hypothetical protein